MGAVAAAALAGDGQGDPPPFPSPIPSEVISKQEPAPSAALPPPPSLQTAASFLNVIGTVLALSGVFLYSAAERKANKPKPSLIEPAPAQPSSSRLQAFMGAMLPAFIR